MVPGWNCYCGWSYALKHGLTGYENNRTHGAAKCMGVVYTFSMWASKVIESLLLSLYRYFVPLALLLLPFGRKRSICDHHRPGLWNLFRRMVAMPSMCRGDCVLASQYSSDVFMDDLAWSIYAIELMCWAYVFSVVLYIFVLFIWSVLLWASVLLLFAAAAFFAVCACCAEGLAGCADSCAGGGCVCDCGACDFCAIPFAHGPLEAEMFYFGGTFPHDPFWTFNGFVAPTSDSECCCCCCRFRQLCLPIAAMVYVFPVLPENAWGGILGYFCLGTHQRTPIERMYTGGNRLVDFLGMRWRRSADLHSDEDWRSRVFDFLAGDPSPEVQPRSDPQAHLLEHLDGKQVLHVGLARAVLIHRPLERVRDKCVPSSFEDYLQNTCWICQEESDEWDMWLSCHHMFCSRCSSQMLIRRMPCPLCRVASTTVLRGACALPRQAFPQVRPTNHPRDVPVPKQEPIPVPQREVLVASNQSRQREVTHLPSPPRQLSHGESPRLVTPSGEFPKAFPKPPSPGIRPQVHIEMPKAMAARSNLSSSFLPQPSPIQQVMEAPHPAEAARVKRGEAKEVRPETQAESVSPNTDEVHKAGLRKVTTLVSLSGMHLIRKKQLGQERDRILCSTAGMMFQLRPQSEESTQPLGAQPQAQSRLRSEVCSTGMMLATNPRMSDSSFGKSPKPYRALSGNFRLKSRPGNSCAGIPYKCR